MIIDAHNIESSQSPHFYHPSCFRLFIIVSRPLRSNTSRWLFCSQVWCRTSYLQDNHHSNPHSLREAYSHVYNAVVLCPMHHGKNTLFAIVAVKRLKMLRQLGLLVTVRTIDSYPTVESTSTSQSRSSRSISPHLRPRSPQPTAYSTNIPSRTASIPSPSRSKVKV